MTLIEDIPRRDLEPTITDAGEREPAKRPAHRPKGTNYRLIDRPLHEEMRRLVEEGIVPTINQAAWAVAERAWPRTSKQESRKRRLVETYPWRYPKPHG